MSDIDFERSTYIVHAPKAGLDVRLIQEWRRNQLRYLWPLLEQKHDLKPSDAAGDFDPRTASVQEIESALRSSSARVRMRAMIALCAKGDVNANTLLFVASLQADPGEWDYEFGKVYSNRFCPTVSFCAQFSLRVLAHLSPAGTLDLIRQLANPSEPERKRVADVLANIGPDPVAAALAINDLISVRSIRGAERVLTGAPDVSALIATFFESESGREARCVAYLASKSIWRLNDFIRTLLDRNPANHSWICEGLLYQREKLLCDQLAERVGIGAVPFLIRGLSSADKNIRTACAYTIARRAGNSGEARIALDTAVRSEGGFLTRWAMRRSLNSMGPSRAH
jgi:hypothetical protein